MGRLRPFWDNLYKLETAKGNSSKLETKLVHNFFFNFIWYIATLKLFSNIKTLQNYVNDFFVIVEGFYNANKLALNSDKSKNLVNQCNKIRDTLKVIKPFKMVPPSWENLLTAGSIAFRGGTVAFSVLFNMVLKLISLNCKMIVDSEIRLRHT